jgi:hypothetical protein
MLELKEAALYELLSKHWGIDIRTEAVLISTRAEPYSGRFLRESVFGTAGHRKKADWVPYKNKYQVIKKLETNPALCELSDEKLKAAIEK